MKRIKDMKVLELASVLAGPSVGQFFAELGAQVIKIENKHTKGDVTRSWKVKGEDPNKADSAYFNSTNFGKDCKWLDLKSDADRRQLNEWIIASDVIIVNFKAGDAEKLKLDFEQVRLLNPGIIYGEIVGFRDSDRLAYDMVLQAESGWLSMNGTAEYELCKIPVAIIDLFAAHQLKEGLLLALLNEDGQAQKVSVSLYESAVSALANQATNWLVAKKDAQPMGMLHPNIDPYGELFFAKDQQPFVLAIGSNSQFAALTKLVGHADWSDDPRFNNNLERVKNRTVLASLLAKVFLSKNRKEWMAAFEANNVPAGAVKRISEVFENPIAQQMVLKKDDTIGLSQIAFRIDQ